MGLAGPLRQGAAQPAKGGADVGTLVLPVPQVLQRMLGEERLIHRQLPGSEEPVPAYIRMDTATPGTALP